MTADPLLETIAKALHEGICGCDSPAESCDERIYPALRLAVAQRVYDRLLSDAGSTQWGVRYVQTGSVRREEHDTARAIARSHRGVSEVVRRQVLELHGDWENA